jgi:acyl-ACP thioesterase
LYEIHDRIGASMTGANGAARLTAALDIIQDCSLFWMESEPSFGDFLARNRLSMLLVSRQADILRLPAYMEKVAARTGVYDCKSFYGYRNTVLYGQDGAPCILTWSIGAFIETDTGRMARIPPEEIMKVTMDKKIDMEYLDKKIVLPEAPGYRPEAIPVRRGDIDLNRHMNNVRYIEAALELLPDNAPVKRIRVEYKSPAKPGDMLYPRIIETPDKRYVLFSDHQGRLYTVMEFTY